MRPAEDDVPAGALPLSGDDLPAAGGPPSPGDFPRGVARIAAAGGAVCGAGFLVADGLVVTCAHVLTAAGARPGGRVRLAFPQAPGAPEVGGLVVAEAWSTGEDIAAVRCDTPPPGVRPLRLGRRITPGSPVSSFGFPEQTFADGHFGYATVGDTLNSAAGARPLLQLRNANDVTRGFSGAPVVDRTSGLVVGMVTSITAPDGYARGQNVAYATPVARLRAALPGVGPEPVNPYRGLAAFSAEDAERFHGRDDAVGAVLAALDRRPRVLVLLGPSGSGKSSLLRAGVLPALPALSARGTERWVPLLADRPSDGVLAAAAAEPAGASGAGGLVAAAGWHLARAGRDARLLLVVDQFEEVFTREAAATTAPAGETLAGCGPGPLGTPPDEAPGAASRSQPPPGARVVTDPKGWFGSLRTPGRWWVARAVPRAPVRHPPAEEAPPNPLSPGTAPGAPPAPEPPAAADALHRLRTPPDSTSPHADAPPAPPPAAADSPHHPRTPPDRTAHHSDAAPESPTPGAPPGVGLVRELAALARADVPVTVVVVVRDDFYAHLAAQAGELLEAAAQNLLNLPATVGPADLREIVAAPAPRAGLVFEDRLVDRIVADVLGAGPAGPAGTPRTAEPRARATLLAPLQVALRDLADRHRDGVMTHAAYESLGTLSGTIARWGNATVEALPGDQREPARRLLTALVRPADPERGVPATRQQVDLDTLLELASAAPGSGGGREPERDRTAATGALRALTGSRIVTTFARRPGPPPEGTVAELIHDAVIREWPELQAWAEADTAFAGWLQRAQERLRLWRRDGGEGNLLHGSDLADGLDWGARRPLPAPVAAFVTDSRRKQQASLRRSRVLASVLALLLVAAVGAWGLLLRQRGALEDQRRQAQSQLLARESVAAAGSDPDLASLLAVLAYRTDPTRQAQDALTAAREQPSYQRVDARGVTPAALAFSPDGQRLAVAGQGGVVTWSAGAGVSEPAEGSRTAIRPSDGRPDVSIFTGAAFTPGGDVVGADDSGGILRWTGGPATSPHHVTPTGTDGSFTLTALAPAAGRYAVSRDNAVVVGDLATGRVLRRFPAAPSAVETLTFTDDGGLLALGLADGRLQTDDLRTGRQHLPTEPDANVSAVVDVAFSANRTLAGVVHADGEARLVDLASGRSSYRVTADEGPVRQLAFSPDGVTVAAGTANGEVQLWSAGPGLRRGTLRGPQSAVAALRFSPDGRSLAVACDDGSVRMWSTTLGRAQAGLRDDRLSVQDVAFAAGGRSVTTLGSDGAVSSWAVAGRAIRPLGRTAMAPGGGYLPGSALSRDGRTVALAGEDGSVDVRDAAGGRLLRTLPGAGRAVDGLVLDADGGRVAVLHPLDVEVWDVRTGRRLLRVPVSTAPLPALALAPSGKAVAVVADGKTVLADVATGRFRTVPEPPVSGAVSVRFSAAEDVLAVGDSYGVSLLDAATGRQRLLVRGDFRSTPTNHPTMTLPAPALAFSPDGRSVASRTADGVVRLWDTATGQPYAAMTTLDADLGPGGLAFSPDGGALVAAAGDTLTVWRVREDPAASAAGLCRQVGRDLTAEERAAYVPPGAPGRACP